MDTTLRPLSLGEVLDRTFQLYRKHFLMFAGISSFAAGLDLLWKLAQTTTVRTVQNHVAATTLGLVSLGFSLVNLVIYLIVSSVAMAAISSAVSAIYLGQHTGIAQAYRQVKGHWFRYVRLVGLALFLAWGPVLLVFIGTLVIAVLAPALLNSTLGASLGILVFLLGMFGGFVFGVWMVLRYSVCIPASLFEDLGVLAALKRSVRLSKGGMQKLSIFVMLFLVWLISAILMYAGLTPFMYVVFRAIYTHGRPTISIGLTIYTLLVEFLVTSVTIPLYSIGLTLFYYDARIRKEGFDVEWLLHRASTSDAPPPPAPAAEPLPAESPGQA